MFPTGTPSEGPWQFARHEPCERAARPKLTLGMAAASVHLLPQPPHLNTDGRKCWPLAESVAPDDSFESPPTSTPPQHPSNNGARRKGMPVYGLWVSGCPLNRSALVEPQAPGATSELRGGLFVFLCLTLCSPGCLLRIAVLSIGSLYLRLAATVAS